METNLDDDEIVYSGEIDFNDLTFMERYVWANLGWVFIEASFRLPNWTFRFAGTWMYPLGNKLYELAFNRWWELNRPTPWKDGKDGEGAH